jgi:hypothetical protein
MTMTIPQTAVASAMPTGLPGQVLRGKPDTAISEEDTNEIPFGLFVVQGDADDGALLPSAYTDRLKGLVVLYHGLERTAELGDTGIKPGAVFGILSEGRALVQVPHGSVDPTSEVHVQAIAETNYPAGTVRSNKSTNKTIDITGLARFLTSGDAGDIVELEFDLTNVGLAVAGS